MSPSSSWKHGGIHVKAGSWKINFFVLNLLLSTTAILAVDAQDTCPWVETNPCPFVTLESGETIQYTAKIITSDLDWLFANIPSDIQIPNDMQHLQCVKPACLSNPCLHGGTCEESKTGFLCKCLHSYDGDRCENIWARDCYEIQARYMTTNGVYVIQPDDDGDPISVYCDMETDGGGWTVFQRRQDGSVDFFLYWSDYKNGFGNISAEHWLGNDNIHRVSTQKTYDLRVDLEDFEGQTRYAVYTEFSIANRTAKYILTIGEYSGNAGESLTERSANQAFSTRDRDNDIDYSKSCATAYTGAWWYGSCHFANLNGQYLQGATTNMHAKGVVWSSWHGLDYSLKKTEMKIRPV